MANFIFDRFEDIYQKNLILLDMIRNERWEDFVSMAEQYVLTLQEVFDLTPSELVEGEKEILQKIILKMQDNEREMTGRLKNRLSNLKKDMSALHHGNKCSQLYSTQFLSIKSSLH